MTRQLLITALLSASLVWQPAVSAKTSKPRHLSALIRDADAIVVGRVTSGNCVDGVCNSPFNSYSIACEHAIRGSCRSSKNVASGARLSIGECYVFFVKDTGASPMFLSPMLIKMTGTRLPDSRIEYSGGYFADGVTIYSHKKALDQEYAYIRMQDFVAAVAKTQ